MDYQKLEATLIGNATKDAELRQPKEESDHAYGDFRLAVRNRRGETGYFPIRCFGKLAEGVIYIRKGSKVFVNGEFEISSFTTEEGQNQKTYRVVANTYRILGDGKQRPDSETEDIPEVK